MVAGGPHDGAEQGQGMLGVRQVEGARVQAAVGSGGERGPGLAHGTASTAATGTTVQHHPPVEPLLLSQCLATDPLYQIYTSLPLHRNPARHPTQYLSTRMKSNHCYG